MRESNITTKALNSQSVAFNKAETPKHMQTNCLIPAGLGGIAGLFMEGVLHPIDTIRTRVKANTKETVSMFRQIKLMQKYEGSRSYFNGFSCTLAGAFVSNASYFYVYEKLKQVSHEHQIMSREAAPFAAAFVAGFLSNILYLPFDVVRTRMQLKPGFYDYRHFFDGARKVLHHEGFSKLYLGGTAFLTLSALETSLTFGFYELFYKILKPFFPTNLEVNLPLSIVCSVTAASAAGFLINPLDVLVTRIQSVNTKVHGPVSIDAMVKSIYTKEGINGFFKGVSGTVSYYALSALILFPTYEVLKSLFHVDLSH